MLRRYPNPTADVVPRRRRQGARRHAGHDPRRQRQRRHSHHRDAHLPLARRLLAYPDPTYSLYPVLAKLEDAKVADRAVGDGLALPIDALLATKAARDLPRQPQRADRHVRLAAEGRGARQEVQGPGAGR